MLDANLIMHASQSEAQCFVDGMFLFFVKSTEKADGEENFCSDISLPFYPKLVPFRPLIAFVLRFADIT